MRDSSDLERVMFAEFNLYKKLEGMLPSGSADAREISETMVRCDYDSDKALGVILKKYCVSPESASDVAAVKRTTTSIGGARVSVESKPVHWADFRASPPLVSEGESQDTPGLVPETPLDSQFVEQSDSGRVTDVNKPEDQSETQVSVPVRPEGGSQETPSFVPETPLDSQILERGERLDATAEVKVESDDQSMARRDDSSDLRLFESVGSAGESNTQAVVPEQEMVDILRETPSESQILQPVSDDMKKNSIRKEEPEKPEELELQSNGHGPTKEGQVVVKEEKIEESEKSGGGSAYPRQFDSVGVEIASEIKPDVQDVQMLDVVQETSSASHDLKPVGSVVKEESVCKSEKMEEKCEPEPENHAPKEVKLESPPRFLTFEEKWKRHRAQLVKEKKLVEAKKEVVVDGIEKGDFPSEPNWLMIGDGIIMASSTTKRRRIEDNEVVEFEFPSLRAPSIIRIRNHRLGEIGRLPMEWSRCLTPLVRSRMVKVRGKCINGPLNLEMMREISLYIGFYASKKLFAEAEGRNPIKLAGDIVGESNLNPLRSLFQLLNIRPVQDAGCTPDDLENRKRSRDLKARVEEVASSLGKRRKIATQAIDLKHEKDEQAISESTLNKLVGAVEVYNLEEMEPSSTLTCVLKPYQKQALHWMSTLESVEDASKTLHPCWAAYQFKNEQPIYVNVFSGEATSKMPSATESSRGGILADAMGLGKTVMTIALILARPGRGIPDEQKGVTTTGRSKVNGGTLIICPMALLGQWKDELETHSEQDSLSVSVHYGTERTDDPRAIAKHDVVLTTYGLISTGFKKDSKRSIYHNVNWYRIVLDEAHTIKAWRTQTAQAVFALSSHCRWCLTGTPLQNNLEDLFSLLCFMKVEPWCNWTCWKEQIQKPYESGDPRGLTWVKAILKPLMLRRTKETKDREGRRILELPPTDVQTIVCEQTEAEKDFYLALFKRSKMQFDEFLAQGKVLNNYANILELLLRLRQCCNHPFLVMSRTNSEKYADLDKLARRFTEMHNSEAPAPPRAFVEEVVEGIRRGETTECPICLESPDDPVLTPCAHRMCRECLLKCWRTPYFGACPICRNEVKKEALITCPSEGRFRVDIQKNWKECAKVSKLMQCLEDIRSSGCGGKSIIFSQWTSFLDLLEIPLKRSGFGFLRFDGQLSQKQRQSVLKEFSETQHKTVMLMSLKAGGVGLNLTAASNVFLMDPWWNPAVEEQAIMRIHRIGQKRTVVVRRFIVKGTVEERLQQVQARKQQMIAGALTDQEVRSARLEELKMLFR